MADSMEVALSDRAAVLDLVVTATPTTLSQTGVCIVCVSVPGLLRTTVTYCWLLKDGTPVLLV